MKNQPIDLSILRRGGRWVDAPLSPGAFLVNIGDLLSRWSNGRWRSPVHRGANPPRTGSQDRLSLSYFHAPNEDAVVASLDASRPPKHPPILAGDYIRRKLEKARRA